LTLTEKDIIDFKINMSKDLEKRIKMGYKSQFQNIMIKITSMPKRYKMIKAPINVSEDLIKLENISKGIFNYLLDMFDVFGDNAILNAKRIFEENGIKWGKKFYKCYKNSYNSHDTKKLLKELYISLKDMDYIISANRQLNWIFRLPEEPSDLVSRSRRYFCTLYEMKVIWLQNFIKHMAPGYNSVFEFLEEDEQHVITIIIIKEGS
jgi:hypothetical protein